MLKSIRHVTVCRNPQFYTTFPAVAAITSNELFAVFRQAPNYCGWPGVSEGAYSHHSCLSRLMSSRSMDGGRSWSEAELLYASPAGGCQDGGLYYDGRYLYANSFLWIHVPQILAQKLRDNGYGTYLENMSAATLPGGCFLLRSADQGHTWEGPIQPDPLPDGSELFPGCPRRMHNRGNLIRGNDGSLLWAGERYSNHPAFHADIMLYRSIDDGRSFQYLSTPADSGGEALYEEPFLHITPKGKYVIMIRSQRLLPDGNKTRADLVTVESLDGGFSWSRPRRWNIHAEPSATCRLDDGRALLVYGYRKPPFGVRGRVLSPEIDDLEEAEQFIIRDDSPVIDVGYPWIAPLGGNRFFIIYYLSRSDVPGAGGIEGSIVQF